MEKKQEQKKQNSERPSLVESFQKLSEHTFYASFTTDDWEAFEDSFFKSIS